MMMLMMILILLIIMTIGMAKRIRIIIAHNPKKAKKNPHILYHPHTGKGIRRVRIFASK